MFILSSNRIAALLKTPEISPYLLFVPLFICITGLYQTINFWLNRNKRFKRLALNRASQAVYTSVGNLTFGALGWGGGGLIFSQIISQFLVLASLIAHVLKFDKLLFPLFSKETVKEQAIRYNDFPKFKLGQTILDSIRENGVVFILAYFFPSAILGFYSFSLRMLRTPLNVIGAGISPVFYQRAAETYNREGNIYPLITKLIKKTALLAAPFFIILAIFGADIFSLVFSAKWRTAGVYSQILSPWLFLNFLISPVSQAPFVLSKQKTFFIISLGYNISIPLLFLIFIPFINELEYIIAIVSAFASLYSIFILSWILKISRESKFSKI